MHEAGVRHVETYQNGILLSWLRVLYVCCYFDGIVIIQALRKSRGEYANQPLLSQGAALFSKDKQKQQNRRLPGRRPAADR